MTSEEIDFLSRLGLRDKLSAMTILSKLGKEEMDGIVEMCRDGLTNKEFAEISTLIENKLDVSEVEELKEILHRSRLLYAESSR